MFSSEVQYIARKSEIRKSRKKKFYEISGKIFLVKMSPWEKRFSAKMFREEIYLEIKVFKPKFLWEKLFSEKMFLEKSLNYKGKYVLPKIFKKILFLVEIFRVNWFSGNNLRKIFLEK